MPKRDTTRPRTVREPVQVYLEPDDSQLLNRLVEESGLSKAEILRRGMRSLARELSPGSPMLRFVMESAAGAWPSAVAAEHDAVLAEEYRPAKRRRR